MTRFRIVKQNQDYFKLIRTFFGTMVILITVVIGDETHRASK